MTETTENSRGSPLEKVLPKEANGERKGTRAVLLGAKAAGSGVEYSTKGPRTSRRDFLGNLLPCCKSELNPVALISFLASRKHTSSAGGVLILCENTTERVALLGRKLFHNTKRKRRFRVTCYGLNALTR
ncbi:hypothetical protein HAX54_019068 [Datura stramonium]|uniref:Uncharacterized protein n=1 Tax=Datura stramonium TaxID=4076 RepID=A0ABS8UQL4_DATST|nr:hypothetical protein [Datura stramonium]